MKIGIPKEIKTNENRVAPVPSGAEAPVAAGHAVLVETGAGPGGVPRASTLALTNATLPKWANDMACISSLMRGVLAVLLAILLPSMGLAAALNDIEAVPHLDRAGQDAYREFLAAERHRAFAIGTGGAWSWRGGEATAESASGESLQACQHDSGQPCILYAVNDKVVFDTKTWARLWGPYRNRTEASQAHIGAERGKHFYNLSFRSSSGKSMTLSDLQGKVVLLHFWGSWCPSCRHEMPELQQLYQALGASSNIQMVLLQVREDFSTARQWARKQHLNLPFFDSGVRDGMVGSLVLAGGNAIPDRNIAAVFPTTYVLDRHGIVVFSHIGPVSHWSQYLPLLRDVAARSGK